MFFNFFSKRIVSTTWKQSKSYLIPTERHPVSLPYTELNQRPYLVQYHLVWWATAPVKIPASTWEFFNWRCHSLKLRVQIKTLHSGSSFVHPPLKGKKEGSHSAFQIGCTQQALPSSLTSEMDCCCISPTLEISLTFLSPVYIYWLTCINVSRSISM